MSSIQSLRLIETAGIILKCNKVEILLIYYATSEEIYLKRMNKYGQVKNTHSLVRY